MRICVTGLRGLPSVMGGVETHCEELLPRVLARLADAEITVCGRKGYCVASQHRGVEVRPLWALRLSRLEAIQHTALSVLYARFWLDADLLHIHGIGPALLTPLAKAFGLRVLVTHHGADYRRAKWGGVARVALRVGEALALLCADQIIAVSASDAERLRRSYPRRAHRIQLLPNGAPTRSPAAVTDASVLRRHKLARGEFVLAVGRLVPEKQFHDLISAMQRRWSAGDTRALVIVGDADHTDAYAQKLLHQPQHNLHFLGRLDRATLGALYRSCAAFVLPSSHEGLPIVALEAIAAGAPVLLSDIAANGDLRLEPRCYFPVGDVAALAARLGQPLAPPSDATQLLARFNWDRIATETARVYARLARGRVKSSAIAPAIRWRERAD